MISLCRDTSCAKSRTWVMDLHLVDGEQCRGSYHTPQNLWGTDPLSPASNLA
ncbi:Uncharacterised protein [Rhodococcus gordoniae]|uniref:Uncharacterized protein n=1 Tax=Rhodococcus gordoniae TaxID=223392 RepID=A0A379LXC3_9NOCA|nr:Uncharacterised protein [Rhodococcus gordoniae]